MSLFIFTSLYYRFSPKGKHHPHRCAQTLGLNRWLRSWISVLRRRSARLDGTLVQFLLLLPLQFVVRHKSVSCIGLVERIIAQFTSRSVWTHCSRRCQTEAAEKKQKQFSLTVAFLPGFTKIVQEQGSKGFASWTPEQRTQSLSCIHLFRIRREPKAIKRDKCQHVLVLQGIYFVVVCLY